MPCHVPARTRSRGSRRSVTDVTVEAVTRSADRRVLIRIPHLVHSGRGSKRVGPHSLRHAFITAALDGGVHLHRDVQEAASHADPRTTMRYEWPRASLDRHATYIVRDLPRPGASR